MYIEFFDYILLLVYLGIFYWRIKKKSASLQDADMRKFFLVAFGLRMLGAVGYSMMVQYYYGYGDSFTYFAGGNFFTDEISKDLGNISYLFEPFEGMQDWYNSTALDTGLSGHFATPASNMVMRISAIISYVSLNRFIIIALFFGLFSFYGQWKLFLVFDDINKHKNRKLLAWVLLYSPSIWFWGSGLLKDSICLGALGFIIYILYKMLTLRKFLFRDLFLLIFFVFIITTIKSYITSIITIGFMVMGFSIFIKTVKIRILRIFLKVFGLILGVLLIYASDLPAQITEIAEESVMQIQEFQKHYQTLGDSEENSRAGFGLGELEPNLNSLLLKSPAVIATCLFRPFLWESRKIIILFTAIESTALLLFTLFIMIKIGLLTFFKTIFNTPHLLFCFIVSMIFALIIGFTTFNFGTMIRYKIIFLPFYYFMLINLFSNYIKTRKAVITPNNLQVNELNSIEN